ncbi:hypothetical protein B0H63DRAFT_454258 [Podospora didyma]|uniref:Uncharacterized protein n=1 Tax=Podospora didyma TaxID=330526 RepID=A0AAE0K4Q5_9PEZI|nr:hypothetical protein B0H63DRAFT_454258 [Podospora didyma]
MCLGTVTIYPCTHVATTYEHCPSAYIDVYGFQQTCKNYRENKVNSNDRCFMSWCAFHNAGEGLWTCCRCGSQNESVGICENHVDGTYYSEIYQNWIKGYKCGHACCDGCMKKPLDPLLEGNSGDGSAPRRRRTTTTNDDNMASNEDSQGTSGNSNRGSGTTATSDSRSAKSRKSSSNKTDHGPSKKNLSKSKSKKHGESRSKTSANSGSGDPYAQYSNISLIYGNPGRRNGRTGIAADDEFEDEEDPSTRKKSRKA